MNYYEKIKATLINNKLTKKVKDYSKNKSDLDSYYKVGKLIVEAQGGKARAKYGDNLIKEYSIKLTKELRKNYNITTLKRIRKIYIMIKKGAALRHQLSWTHYRELLSLKNINEINYYINVTIKQNLSYRKLKEKIQNQEYQRLDKKTKQKLITKEQTIVTDFLKNPIIINNKYNYTHITEKFLQKLIIEDINNFLLELGNGFSYIKNEYPIKLGDEYNYIDILLYNYIYNCFVVVELKITELKKEHIGQIHTYMNYIDKNLKSINQDKTIGIIIVKKDNKYIMEYCSDDRIFRTTYVLE